MHCSDVHTRLGLRGLTNVVQFSNVVQCSNVVQYLNVHIWLGLRGFTM